MSFGIWKAPAHIPNVVWHMEGAGSICKMSFGIWKAPVPYAKSCLAYGRRRFHMPNVVCHMEGAGSICQMLFGIWMAPAPYAKSRLACGRRRFHRPNGGFYLVTQPLPTKFGPAGRAATPPGSFQKKGKSKNKTRGGSY